MLPDSKGAILVFLTAIISGFSIYLNKFAVSGFNPFILTALKNSLVALLLLSAILLFMKFSSFKQLSKKDWLLLSMIGISGGGIAFLLFFYGLSLTSAVNSGFLHKTIFIFASFFALVLLKEKISKKLFFSGLAAFAGLLLLFGLQISSFGIGDFAILAAVLLWAFEITLAKKALQRLSGTIVAFGRMFFGSITILAFLAFTNQASGIFSLNTLQLEWVLLTSAFLFAYVLTFYNGLKFISVSKAAIILLAAIPITAFLSMLDAKPFTLLEILANSFLLASIIFAVFSLDSAKAFLRRRFSWKI